MTPKISQCQLKSLTNIVQKNSRINELVQLRVRLIWSLKKKGVYLKNIIFEPFKKKGNSIIYDQMQTEAFKPGDWVKVKSKDDILNMLDKRGSTNGCMFTPEMYGRCGEKYRVIKKVNYFYDEVKNKLCKCRDIYVLEGALCTGQRRVYLKDCDRCCFQFWHKDWLTKS